MINMLCIYFATEAKDKSDEYEEKKEAFLKFLQGTKTMQDWITWFKNTENYNYIHTSLQNFSNYISDQVACLNYLKILNKFKLRSEDLKFQILLNEDISTNQLTIIDFCGEIEKKFITWKNSKTKQLEQDMDDIKRMLNNQLSEKPIEELKKSKRNAQIITGLAILGLMSYIIYVNRQYMPFLNAEEKDEKKKTQSQNIKIINKMNNS